MTIQHLISYQDMEQNEEANQSLNIKKIKEKILVNSCPINTNSTKQKKKAQLWTTIFYLKLQGKNRKLLSINHSTKL